LVELRIEDPGVGGSTPSLSTKKIEIMNRVFRTVNGETIPDVVKHTLGVLKECPWVEVHIGTDSQNHRRSTIYVTVIAYRYGNRGVHYILHKQKVKKIKDKWTRLWNEADYSIEVAEWLTQKVKVKVEIDFDFNSDEKHFSSKLVQPAVGWAASLGYKTNIKPHNQIATKAADHHCR
jgi:predicted RNase H-related nuclease YkuK (DUF458 family)